MKNRWLVLFAFVHCVTTAMVFVAMLFQGLTLIGVEPKPASFGALGLAFRLLTLPALEPLAQLLPAQPSPWIEWAIVPLNSALAALILKLACEGVARLRRRARA